MPLDYISQGAYNIYVFLEKRMIPDIKFRIFLNNVVHTRGVMKRMLRILADEIVKNKKFVLSYVISCVFLAVTGGMFLIENGGVVYAAEVPVGETIASITMQVVGTSVASFAGSYASLVGVSCEPFAALLFIGILEHVNRWIGSPFHMMETPLSNLWVLLVVAIFFAISKLLKANEATQILGTITLGELEKYTGLAFVVVIGIMNVTGLTTVSIQASGSDSVASAGGFIGVLTACLSFFFAVISVVVFFIIKTVMKGLDVIQMSLTFIPGVTLVIEVLKTVITCFIILVNVICPPLGIAINVIIFIICCFLFKYCYNASKYFQKIYVKPLLRLIRGFDPHIPLVLKKLPRKIKKEYSGRDLPDMIIPIYPLKYYGSEKVSKYERWYLISDERKSIFKKYKMFKKVPATIECQDTARTPVYLKKGLWYFEIFHYIDTQDNLDKKFPRKEYSFVFSKEYYYKHEEILFRSGLADYEVLKQERREIKQQNKAKKRALRAERREERRLLFEEKKMALMEARFKIKKNEKGN